MKKVEYIWLDAKNNLRSKTKIFPDETPLGLVELPTWNYDGSSTGQTDGSHSEIHIKPQRLYKNPFGDPHSRLVLCDTYWPSGDPHPTNTRARAVEIFNKGLDLHPWFGMEQEFFIIDKTTNMPLGFPRMGYPEPQGPYYCGVGAGNAYGRTYFEEAELNCLNAGINLTGKNFEVAPGQLEFQVFGEGIRVADDVMMLRYILARTGEKYGLGVNFEPKPVSGDWNGSGCHTNYSYTKTREEGGYEWILDAIAKLEVKHDEHIKLYGLGNESRLTGHHETAPITEFRSGVGDRGASVRIPTVVHAEKKGYLEDRRPAANCDPYVVTSKIFETTCLSKIKIDFEPSKYVSGVY